MAIYIKNDKNILNPLLYRPHEFAGVTTTIINNDEVWLQGTATTSSYIPIISTTGVDGLEPIPQEWRGKTLSLYSFQTGSHSNNFVELAFYDSKNSKYLQPGKDYEAEGDYGYSGYYDRLMITPNFKSFTIPDGADKVLFRIRYTKGQTYNCIFKLMLCEGEKDNSLEYSHYGFQEITLFVKDNSNLFDMNKVTGLKNKDGTALNHFLVKEDNKIKVKYGRYASGIYLTGNEIYLEPGQYTFSVDAFLEPNDSFSTTAIYLTVLNIDTKKEASDAYTKASALSGETVHITHIINVTTAGIYRFLCQGSGNKDNYLNISIWFSNIEFRNVGGTLQRVDTFIKSDKNLFDIRKASTTRENPYSGLLEWMGTTINLENNSVEFTEGSKINPGASIDIPLLAGTYTISFKRNEARGNVVLRNGKVNSGGIIGSPIYANETSKTFTFGPETHSTYDGYLRISCFTSGLIISDIQIEKGTAATSYTTYKIQQV